MPRISVEKRSRIHALVQEGFPSRYVANKENVWQIVGGSVKDLPKEGRPRLLTERDKRNAIRLLTSAVVSVTILLKKYLNWSVEDWRSVIWSDESKFKIYGSDGHQYCWKRKNEPFNERNVIPTKKYGGGSVMVWGVFHPLELEILYEFLGQWMGICTVPSNLTEDLLGTLRWHRIRKHDIIFQQDNDSKHTAKDTAEWFYHNGIEVLDWPPYSPT
ncbi:28317_t:CDS:2 [Gigaspora margarita]|uniref:28317_t:CDS:1 n=1 Tax=Gigaspora margarita TaxID=4874 RepID=A0ABN7V6Y4_GIGMA|nr:28317_t:CDS:2 [Gigaspora margarita]